MDKAARTRIDAALQTIDDTQAVWPSCVCGGQHTRQLDTSGACSKTTEIHKEHREGR